MQIRATIQRPRPTYGLAVSGISTPSAVSMSKIQKSISKTIFFSFECLTFQLPYLTLHPAIWQRGKP